MWALIALCVVLPVPPEGLTGFYWRTPGTPLPCTHRNVRRECVQPRLLNHTHAQICVPDRERCEGRWTAWIGTATQLWWIVGQPPPPDPWCATHATQWQIAPPPPDHLDAHTLRWSFRTVFIPLLLVYTLGALMCMLREPQRAWVPPSRSV